MSDGHRIGNPVQANFYRSFQVRKRVREYPALETATITYELELSMPHLNSNDTNRNAKIWLDESGFAALLKQMLEAKNV